MIVNLRKVVVSLAVTAFAVLSLAVRDARGQSGICVVDTQTITYHCFSGCSKSGCACSSMTSLLEPAGGYGTGQIYQSAKTQCCSSDLSYIQNPSGSCHIGATPTTLALGTRRVFVRDCGGRFRLVTVAG